MTHRADRPTVETWRQHPTDRPETRATAEETACKGGGGSAGDMVETEWRHQALSIPLLPSLSPSPPTWPRPADGADARQAGPVLAAPALEAAFGGAKGLPARAAHRPAVGGPGLAKTAEAVAVTVTKRQPKSPAERKRAQRKRDRAALVAGAVPMADLNTSALLDSLPALLTGDYRSTLALVLRELGRRGGVTVTISAAGCSGPG